MSRPELWTSENRPTHVLFEYATPLFLANHRSWRLHVIVVIFLSSKVVCPLDPVLSGREDAGQVPEMLDETWRVLAEWDIGCEGGELRVGRDHNLSSDVSA